MGFKAFSNATHITSSISDDTRQYTIRRCKSKFAATFSRPASCFTSNVNFAKKNG
ncbi:hypothetical protein Plhal304r1_c005g0020261 [Plasmopara halstedii]